MENKTDLQQIKSEDIYLNRPSRAMKPIKEDEEAPKRDYMTFMIAVQTIVCILLLIGLFIFSKAGGDSFSDFKSEFNRIMAHDMGLTGIKETLQSAIDFVMAPADKWREKTDDADTVADVDPDPDETTSTIPQKNAGLGMGGPVIDVENGKAPTHTSFAQYTITAKITPPIAKEKGEISSGFGYRNDPISGALSFHAGLDIAADEGTNIAAAYNGTVQKTGTDDTSGNYILLEHDNGLITFYCHCVEVIAQPGEKIRAGETIAKVGSTGYSTGPHLHFEIRLKGIKYNPEVALDGVYT